MQNIYISIAKIIPKNIIPAFQLTTFKVALVNKKVANKAINILRQLQALKPSLSYLKRVRNLSQSVNQIQCVQILLCQSAEQQLYQRIHQKLIKQMEKDLLNILQISIPKNSPINKQQFNQWSKYWPINFIQTPLSKQIIHQKQELELIQKLTNQSSNILLFSDKLLIDYESNSQKQQLVCFANSYPPNHPVMKMAAQWPLTQQFLQQQKQYTKQNYYYFTNLKLLLKQTKLCAMCSMALVHSRLQRIYFYNCFPCEEIQNVLFNQKLNHKVDMFQVKVKQKVETDQICNQIKNLAD